MQTFKYYGSTKATNAKGVLTVILYMLTILVSYKYDFRESIYRGILNNTYLHLMFSSLLANFLVSKIVKRYNFKSLVINLNDGILSLPKKYYWSKKSIVNIPLKNIRYLLNQNIFLNKGILIDFEDTDGNLSSLLLEENLFESKKSMNDFLEVLNQKLGFSLVLDGHFYYSKNKEIYAK